MAKKERDLVAEVASNIAQGGWSSIYDLVSRLTPEQLAEYDYSEDGEACEVCGEYFDEGDLIEDQGDVICEQCYKKEQESK